MISLLIARARVAFVLSLPISAARAGQTLLRWAGVLFLLALAPTLFMGLVGYDNRQRHERPRLLQGEPRRLFPACCARLDCHPRLRSRGETLADRDQRREAKGGILSPGPRSNRHQLTGPREIALDH